MPSFRVVYCRVRSNFCPASESCHARRSSCPASEHAPARNSNQLLLRFRIGFRISSCSSSEISFCLDSESASGSAPAQLQKLDVLRFRIRFRLSSRLSFRLSFRLRFRKQLLLRFRISSCPTCACTARFAIGRSRCFDSAQTTCRERNTSTHFAKSMVETQYYNCFHTSDISDRSDRSSRS